MNGRGRAIGSRKQQVDSAIRRELAVCRKQKKPVEPRRSIVEPSCLSSLSPPCHSVFPVGTGRWKTGTRLTSYFEIRAAERRFEGRRLENCSPIDKRLLK